MKLIRFTVNLVAAPLVLLLAFGVAFMLVKSRKAPPVIPIREVIANVSVMRASPQTVTPSIQTYGKTQPYLSTALSSQIGGEVLEISPLFEVGNFVSKDQWLARINPADYEANLANRLSVLASAQQSLAQEQTRSQLAEEDWVSAGRSLDDANALTLRKPQLEAAEALLASASAAVEQARTDLQRATLRAPFDAIVESRDASPGNVVTRGTPLGSLIARERLQVRLPITPAQASRLKLPRGGSSAQPLVANLSTPSLPEVHWQARIGRVEPSVDPKNQTLYLVGEIDDPFEDPDAFMPVGAFVDALVSGEPIADVYRLPESAVVDDAFVWVVSPEQTLAKQAVRISFSQDGQILAKIDSPLFELPLRVLTLPLASLKAGQKVNAIETTPES